MAAVELLEFPEIEEIELTSELIAWNQREETEKQRFEALGGIAFLAELAQFSKKIRPTIYLMVTEDLINYNCLCYKYLYDGIYTKQYNEFFLMLKTLRDYNAPIDGVRIQNNFWIYAPPDRTFIDSTLEQIKGLGYEIASPDTIVGIDNHPPYSEGYIPPINITQLPEGVTAYEKQADIYALSLDAYLDAGATRFGFGSASDATGDVFDESQKPKLAYFEVLRVLYDLIFAQIDGISIF